VLQSCHGLFCDYWMLCVYSNTQGPFGRLSHCCRLHAVLAQQTCRISVRCPLFSLLKSSQLESSALTMSIMMLITAVLLCIAVLLSDKTLDTAENSQAMCKCAVALPGFGTRRGTKRHGYNFTHICKITQNMVTLCYKRIRYTLFIFLR